MWHVREQLTKKDKTNCRKTNLYNHWTVLLPIQSWEANHLRIEVTHTRAYTSALSIQHSKLNSICVTQYLSPENGLICKPHYSMHTLPCARGQTYTHTHVRAQLYHPSHHPTQTLRSPIYPQTNKKEITQNHTCDQTFKSHKSTSLLKKLNGVKRLQGFLLRSGIWTRENGQQFATPLCNVNPPRHAPPPYLP